MIFIFGFISFVLVYAQSVCDPLFDRDTFKGGKFPDGFLWSAATASYQVEGAWREDSRGNSIWDDYTHYWGPDIVNEKEVRCHVDKCHTGDIACDSYHQWQRDIDLVKSMGLQGMDIYICGQVHCLYLLISTQLELIAPDRCPQHIL